MTERISTLEVRARMGDLLDRVALRHDEFIIERKGKPLAALVPVERLEQMQRAARQGLRDLLAQQARTPGARLAEQRGMEEALTAQKEARAARTKAMPQRKPKVKKRVVR